MPRNPDRLPRKDGNYVNTLRSVESQSEHLSLNTNCDQLAHSSQRTLEKRTASVLADGIRRSHKDSLIIEADHRLTRTKQDTEFMSGCRKGGPKPHYRPLLLRRKWQHLEAEISTARNQGRWKSFSRLPFWSIDGRSRFQGLSCMAGKRLPHRGRGTQMSPVGRREPACEYFDERGRQNTTRPHRLIDYPAWFADTAKCVQPASRVPSIAFRYIPRPSSES